MVEKIGENANEVLIVQMIHLMYISDVVTVKSIYTFTVTFPPLKTVNNEPQIKSTKEIPSLALA